ncbi:MAG: hypothetical protein IJP29_02480 [Lachnospiraceae bacterium]|nr:hypothetical protein [Lachnospiraceae bacterium]
MKILLILIMVAALVMIITYFIAFTSQKRDRLIPFRISMLVLILLIIITWIVSMVLHQPFHILLGLAVIFILLYIYS